MENKMHEHLAVPTITDAYWIGFMKGFLLGASVAFCCIGMYLAFM